MPVVAFRNSRAMVDDAEGSITSERNGDLRTSRCMPNGIFYQVARDFGERLLRPQHHERFALDVQCQGNTLRGSKMSERLSRPTHDPGCIQLFYAASIWALQPCEAQELAHNAAHALDFRAQNSHVIVAGQSLESRLDHGGWRPELVGCIGREPALNLDSCDQALEARVDGRYQRLHLAWRLPDGERCLCVPEWRA